MNAPRGNVSPLRPQPAAPPPKAARACGRCEFFNGIDPGQGECRRRPPVLVPHAEDAPETLFPRVRRDSWCGMFSEAPR